MGARMPRVIPNMRRRTLFLAFILFAPIIALAGGKGGGGYSPPPPPAPTCNDPYYFCQGNDLYQHPSGANVTSDIFVQSCKNGCSNGACVDEAGPPPLVYTPPTCSVTFDTNPVAPGESTTMHWTSSNAYSMYINGIGYVDPSGSATVNVNDTTDFSGIATGYTAPAGAPTPSETTSAPPPQSNTITFSTPGTYSYNWTAPVGVTNIHVTVVGGGGGGAAGQAPDDDSGCDCSAGGGGGSGGVITSQPYSVTPGNTYQIIVGHGGKGGVHKALPYCPGIFPGEDGTDSSFGSLVATGGKGGNGPGSGGMPGGGNGCGSIWYSSGPTCGGSNSTSHGSGGGGGGCYASGSNGADGYVSISWDTPAGVTTTPPPSSISVPCTATLSTTQSRAPSAHITADSKHIWLGQSTGIHADFAAGTSDTLTADNIDSPEGHGVTDTTAPDAHKDITFTPTETGVYTFYARLTTTKFPNWTTYANVSVDVVNPTCSSDQYLATAAPYNVQCMCIIDNSIPVDGKCPTACSASEHMVGNKCLCNADNAEPIFGQCSGAMCTVGATSCGGTDLNGDGTGDDVYRVTDGATCAITFDHSCGTGSYCVAGQCIALPPTAGFKASPALVTSGSPTKLVWNATEVNPGSCSVTGSNGQSWGGEASGVVTGTCTGSNASCPSGSQCVGTECVASKTTFPITVKTIFTLACTGLDGSALSKSLTVSVAPVFHEQ